MATSNSSSMRNIGSTKTNMKTVTKTAATKKTAPPPKKKGLLKKLLIVFLIIVLLVGGFFAGIYLRLFNTKELNSVFHFDDWPGIGTYFKKSDSESTEKNKVEKVDVSGKGEQTDKGSGAPGQGAAGDLTKNPQNANNQQVANPQTLMLSKQKIEAEQKAQQAAINNRISQLAQMFAQMDPQKAAAVMAQLNNNMVAAILQQMDSRNSAQIISAFSPNRGAEITQTLYNGVTLPTISDLNAATGAAGSQQGGTQAAQ